MKKKLGLVLAFALLMLTACGTESSNPVKEELVYTVSSSTYSEDFYTDDIKIASYNYVLPKLTASTSEGEAVCSEFNGFFKEYADKLAVSFKDDVYTLALDDYTNARDSGDEWGEKFYSDSINYTYVETKNYLGIMCDSYTNVGGNSLIAGTSFYMFDKVNGKFFTYEDLSDDKEGFKQAISKEIMNQLTEQGGENLTEDYEHKVKTLENVQMCFSEEGVMVVIPRVALNPKNIGTQLLLIHYSVIEPFLNDYAMDLFYEYTGVVG